MAHTNKGRVLLGGLLAGLIINVLESVVNGVVLGKVWAQAMQALGRPPVFPASAVVLFWVWGFLFGIAGLWIYAAIRPRYGAGTRTALRAGLVAWVLGSFLPNMAFYPMHLFRGRLLALATAIALVEIVLGVLAGAAIYREKETPTVLAAAA